MSLILLAVIAIIAGTKVATMTWSAIRNWMSRHRVPQGTGEILRKKLANGEYSVVAGVFSPQRTIVAHKTWTAKALDGELEQNFQKGGGKIVVRF
jgi:hypothetical protein